MKLPDEVNIVGIVYKIEYFDRPSDVDVFKRASVWGQCDFWTRTIRVYKNDLSNREIWNTIMHEVLHAIVEALNLGGEKLDDDDKTVDVLAITLVDVLVRNGWMKS